MVARIDESIQKQIPPLWREGLTTGEISKRLGIAPTTATRYLTEAGIDVVAEATQRRYLISPDADEEIIRRYLAGENVGDLAKAFGYASHVSILKRLRAAGVPTRKRGNRERVLTAEESDLVDRRHREGFTDEQIAKEVGCCARVVARWLKRNGYRDNWHNGIRKLNDGYVGQWVQPDHPFYCMADHQGTIRQHRLVMAEALGRPLLPGETVHHINGKRDDNRLENLQLRTSNHGPGIAMACLDCGSHRIAPVPI